MDALTDQIGAHRSQCRATAQEVRTSMRDLSAPSTPKRVRVAPNLWQRTKDGRFEDIRVNPATGKQQLRTLKARTLTEAKRAQRALAVSVDRGEAVAPTRT